MTQPEINPATACPTEDDLQACARGQLPEGWALLLLQHVEQCPACRQQYDLFVNSADGLLPPAH